MINTLWKDQKDVFVFLLKVGFIYASWRILKYFGENTPGFLFGWWEKLYAFGAHALAESSAYVLRILGYKVYQYKRIVIPEGYPGVEIADLCVGIPSIYIFTGLILAFGNNWRDKVWFIPMGWFFIYVVNVFRVLSLLFVQMYYERFFNFAHTYLYVAITYSLIFLLLVIWMEKFAYRPK